MPFAIALVAKEDYDNYDYFFHHLEEYKDGDIKCYINERSCVVWVDGHLGCLKALREHFDCVTIARCHHHFLMNVKSVDRSAMRTVMKALTTMESVTHERALNMLLVNHPKVHHMLQVIKDADCLICAIDVHRVAPTNLGNMTTNIVEQWHHIWKKRGGRAGDCTLY